MTALKISTEEPKGHQGNGEWLQITPGERFTIRTSVDETEGRYTMIEMVADPRNGVPMHIHKNEDEHFVVLEGTLRIVNGDKTLDAPAGTAVTVIRGVPHAWCNLSDTPIRMLLVFSPGHIEGLFKETAVREAQLMGINNAHQFALAMALSLAIVSVAGVFLGIRTNFDPSIGPTRLIFAFEAVIIGGLGDLWGTFVGGVILGVAQTLGARINPGYQILAGHLVFLAILTLRPQGFFAKLR
jgi:mannose-6-phosphate isomerase-like protein (cupin superfamily)